MREFTCTIGLQVEPHVSKNTTHSSLFFSSVLNKYCLTKKLQSRLQNPRLKITVRTPDKLFLPPPLPKLHLLAWQWGLLSKQHGLAFGLQLSGLEHAWLAAFALVLFESWLQRRLSLLARFQRVEKGSANIYTKHRQYVYCIWNSSLGIVIFC